MAELVVNLETIYNNAQKVVELSKSYGISITSVVKGCNAMPNVARTLLNAGVGALGDSRLHHIKSLRDNGIDAQYWMLRLPPISCVNEVVEYADVSLVSEISTLNALNEAAKFQKKKHGVVLMIDIGDLREGWWPAEDLLKEADALKKLDNIDIMGVGMNSSCYGSVVPTSTNVGKVVEVCDELSNILGRELPIRSGGNTTSVRLMLDGTMPKGVTNLRVGEAILLARDLVDLWNTPVPGTRTDSFTLRAEVIEVKVKPSHPVGELFVDAFGRKPKFEDRGLRKRALLAVGKADFLDATQLVCNTPGIQILGASSDHLILDIEDYEGDLKVGDFLEFGMFYGAMLFLTASPDVKITYKNTEYAK